MRVTFRARIRGALLVRDRGTFVEVSILEGTVKAGECVRLPLVDGGHTIVRVEAVEFVDRTRGQDSGIALHVPSVGADDVVVGGEVVGQPNR